MKHKYIYMFIIFSVAIQAVKALAADAPMTCAPAAIEEARTIKTRGQGTKPLTIYIDSQKQTLTVYEKLESEISGRTILAWIIFGSTDPVWIATEDLQDIPVSVNDDLVPRGTFGGKGGYKSFSSTHQIQDNYGIVFYAKNGVKSLIRDASPAEQCAVNARVAGTNGDVLVPHEQMEKIFKVVIKYGMSNVEILVRPARFKK